MKNEWVLARTIAELLDIKSRGSSYQAPLADTAAVNALVAKIRAGISVEEAVEDAIIRNRLIVILTEGGTAALAGMLRSACKQTAVS